MMRTIRMQLKKRTIKLHRLCNGGKPQLKSRYGIKGPCAYCNRMNAENVKEVIH